MHNFVFRNWRNKKGSHDADPEARVPAEEQSSGGATPGVVAGNGVGNGVATASTNVSESSQTQSEAHPRSVAFKLPFLGFVQIPGSLLLLLVPILWASYSIVIKWLYRLPWALNPSLFNFLRLIVCSAMVTPTLLKGVSRPAVTAGVQLGFLTVLVNILQIVGLRYTTASRAAFLSQLSTVLVPLLALSIGLERSPSAGVIVSAPLSVLGVALLTLDGAAPSFLGDSIMTGVAFVAAVYILRSKTFSSLPSNALVATKTVFQTLFAGVFLLATGVKQSFVGATPLWLAVNAGLVVWTGFVVGFFATWLQMKGQTAVTASEAAVIFATNPLWSAFMAISLGERFGPKGFAGASLILAATALASGIGGTQKRKQVGAS